MAEASKIEWTDKTWNPITGCSKKSSGCINCYAEIMARRLKAMGQKKYINGFNLTIHEDTLTEPLKWKGHHNIFVCSMSDIFHEEVPYSFIDKMVEIMHKTPQHQYQILTKRAERMAEYFSTHSVPKNVWLGVTVENKATVYRIDLMRNLKAPVKFLSCEPLLEDLGTLDLTGIDWMIVGGESGPKGRPMLEEWVLNLWEQTKKQNTKFFFKQWGTWGADGKKRNKHANGIKIQGKIVQEMPDNTKEL